MRPIYDALLCLSMPVIFCIGMAVADNDRPPAPRPAPVACIMPAPRAPDGQPSYRLDRITP